MKSTLFGVNSTDKVEVVFALCDAEVQLNSGYPTNHFWQLSTVAMEIPFIQVQ